MTNRKKVVLYPRVSSLKQVSNDSLATQRREMQRFAEQHGYEVVRIFEDRGKSAKTANRPALREMLDWISEQGGKIYAVLVLDYNRAARNVQDHFAIRAMLKTQGSRLISITQPVSEDAYGRFSEVIFAGIAELENAIRGERSKLGMVSATKRGRWCHQAPVGYVNCGRNAVPSLSHDSERAGVVRATFTRIASGEAPQSVYAELVERGFGTRRGGIIGRQTFYSVLRNPVYCGQLVTKLGVREGDWKPLVEQEVWERVQAVVSQTDRRGSSTETRSSTGKRSYQRVRKGFELRGWLRCRVCGQKLSGGVTKGYAYINCVDGHVRARCEDLNERFQKWMEAVSPNETFFERLGRAVRRELDRQQEALTRRRAGERSAVRRVKTKLDRLNLALVDGTMDREAYRETYPRLKAQLQVLHGHGVEDEVEQFDVDTMLLFARHLLSQPGRLWADGTPETRIGLQRALFPHGLVVNKALEFSTDPNHYDSMTYLLFGQGKEGMASPRGILRFTMRGAVVRRVA